MRLSSKSAARETGDIRALQYGRGVAALMLCLFHYEAAVRDQFQAEGSFHRLFNAGHSGVEFASFSAYYYPSRPS
jgi:peptidoglycan/LPS O-acetylase OafA/YrhL